MNHLLIVGAGGHAAVVAEAAELSGQWQCVSLLDDRYPGLDSLDQWPVLGNIDSAGSFRDRCSHAIVAIGDNQARLKLLDSMAALGYALANVVHPRATLSPRASLHGGCVLLAGSVVNARTSIGRGCIVNTGATVDHDCVLAHGVHVAPGANIAATVSLGAASWIGVGASIRENICVGENAIVGAGAAVVGNVNSHATVIGVPAR